MPIPSSGLFTSATVAAEFGLTAPFTSAQVAAAAGISAAHHSDTLRGKSGVDAIPNAVDWPTVIVLDEGNGFGNASGVGEDRTITGISGPAITLLVSIAITNSQGPQSIGSCRIHAEAKIGGVGGYTFEGSQSWPMSSSPTKTFNITGVTNGTIIRFGGTINVSPSFGGDYASANFGATVTISNTSSGGTVLDTFYIGGEAVYNQPSGPGGLG